MIYSFFSLSPSRSGAGDSGVESDGSLAGRTGGSSSSLQQKREEENQ
jgi:hypothetical protein